MVTQTWCELNETVNYFLWCFMYVLEGILVCTGSLKLSPSCIVMILNTELQLYCHHTGRHDPQREVKGVMHTCSKQVMGQTHCTYRREDQSCTVSPVPVLCTLTFLFKCSLTCISKCWLAYHCTTLVPHMVVSSVPCNTNFEQDALRNIK